LTATDEPAGHPRHQQPIPEESSGRISIGAPWPEVEAKPVRAFSSPYRPDSVADGWEVERFLVRAASVRGDSHRHFGVPRQDDMSLAWNGESGVLVIAVADGVSNASQSHVGAGMACRYAVEYTLRQTDVASIAWRDLFHGCAWALIEAGQRLEHLPEPDPARAEQLLATTLCVVILSAGRDEGPTVQAGVVGDSGVAVIRDGQIFPLLGVKASGDGIVETQVVPLPRVPDEPVTGQWKMEPAETLLIGTDGVWDPVGHGSTMVGRFLVENLSSRLPSRLDFLRLIDFYRETHDDDRTLVAVRLREWDEDTVPPDDEQTARPEDTDPAG
jgi:serine/threonine protein phosphatase PrpC